ncbi:hypothetical protein [Deinococcus peraridilitoris]|uniref:Uncharacterized protein n=1 Tax=Deinococcus peraridilitoris (strain DSM 19664 / LMG 22246 / CIP 109416 / KR-200) TaxID=937777 RepID=L0A0N7_DEIPD|nr:hypothetical protein [Deinococcus peraridilitoris]AFZ67019.1 hypothetical protein Deipe_1478 [Deinococcus peraridilitoris DSM 19664]
MTALQHHEHDAFDDAPLSAYHTAEFWLDDETLLEMRLDRLVRALLAELYGPRCCDCGKASFVICPDCLERRR